MKQVIVEKFGGVEELKIVESPTLDPHPGLVRVRITSIGMNHAELLGRKGLYKISTGEPPFTPGLEAGGIIDAIGADVTTRRVGDRVILTPDAPRLSLYGSSLIGCSTGGTYRTHYFLPPQQTIVVPRTLSDEQLGTLWLPYLTAWGCLIWKHGLDKASEKIGTLHTAPGFVALSAATSSVALAAAQIIKHLAPNYLTIGLTSSPQKIAALKALPSCCYDQILATRDETGHDRQWRNDIKQITQGRGVDVIFDPIANGPFLDTEIKSLAPHGTLWIYGLLGKPGVVDVSPLMRNFGSIRGWVLSELIQAGPTEFLPGCQHVLDGFAAGIYKQHIDRTFGLDHVQEAHRYMEKAGHIGKIVLVP